MGRTVVVEECLKSDLEQLVALQQFQIGILIGQLTQSKDYVSLVTRTPTLQEISKENAESESSTSSNLFEEWWVVEHARQMYALLPGGLSVVGVFVCCSSEQFKNVPIRVLKILKDLQQYSQRGQTEASNHSILLHCSSNTKRHSCQTTVLTDPQGGYRPAELKYQSHRDQWHCLESCLTLNTQCHIEGKEGASVQELIKSGLQSVVDEVWSSVVTVRGRVVKDESEPLVKPKKGQQQQHHSHIKMGWLLRKPISHSLTPPTSLSKTRRLRLDGNMSLFAYVHTKATCGEAASAIKQDAERSLLARVTALCESSAENDSDGDLSYCQLPCRLAVVLPNNPQHLTEYKFPEEDTQDAVSRVCELTGLSSTSLATRQLEQSAEVTMETVEDRQKEEEVASDSVVKRYSAVLSIVATVTVALLAIAIWFVMSISS